MDLFEDEAPAGPGNQPEFTVSELSGAVKRVIEGEFGLVRVRGEVGRVSRPASGHLYLDLKDDRAVLAGIIWKGRAQQLSTRPEEGMEVIATGRLTTFPGQSKYQMIIEDIAPAGVGALMAMLEKRRVALAAEGLFDAARKRPLPYMPEVIGVITSPSGAVIRDILHRLRDRFPRRVLVWPVAVQGAACAPEVARAIAGFNALAPGGPVPRPDLIIVARGGGSVEDLWGFNEEVVVRAAAASAIPLISAVGHETDTTLIDFAADRRAPTPTAAAELAVPVRLDLVAVVADLGARGQRALAQGLGQRQTRLRDLARALPRAEALLDPARQRLDGLDGRLPLALRATTVVRRAALAEVALRPGLLRRALGGERDRLARLAARLDPALGRVLRDKGEVARTRGARLRLPRLAADLARRQEALAGLLQRLAERAARAQERRQARLAALEQLRLTLGYQATLARGYAVVRGGGVVVSSVAAARGAGPLEIQFADGRLVTGGRAASRKPGQEDSGEQGTLL